jgi:hypothetical protein
MKQINNLKFAGLAALAILAVTLLFQPKVTRADDHRQQGGQTHGDATVYFTNWVSEISPPSGIFADMDGVITGGDVGDGIFIGEALTRTVDSEGVIRVEAVYHLLGSKHSFTARIHAVQQVAGIGQKGTITGVVTEGWLKGHAVEGEWTVIPPCGYDGGVGIGNCFDLTLNIIKRHSND